MKLRPVIITVLLIAINVICFMLEVVQGSVSDGQQLLEQGASFAPYIRQGEYYRLVTSIFMHFDITHLANNMIALWALGSYLEPRIGGLRIFLTFFLGGLAGNILSFAWDELTGDYAISVGASGGVFALFGCILFLFLFRRNTVSELSAFRVIMALGFLFAGNFESNVNVSAHLGGFTGGFLLQIFVPVSGKTQEKQKQNLDFS